MGVIVYMCLVFMFARRVLVRVVCMTRSGVVVLVRVRGCQVLYRSRSASFGVVGYMNMFVAVNDFLMIV